MSDRRVAITGVGVVTPLGHTVDAFWSKLMDCACGIGPLTYFDTVNFACRIGGQAWGFDPAKEIGDVREVKRLDAFAQFAISATKQAVADAGIDFDQLDKSRCGVLIGSGIGGLATLEAQHEILINPGTFARLTIYRAPFDGQCGQRQRLDSLWAHRPQLRGCHRVCLGRQFSWRGRSSDSKRRY